ncbi:MAG: TIGR00282 family metallophosphoesterase [Termitinemataceae bacterium]
MPDKESSVTLLMIGDVVGEPGLQAITLGLPALRSLYNADFIVVNGENAASGFGLTAEALQRILDAGADVVTTGNHIWEKRDFWPILDENPQVLRPANYPDDLPGRGLCSIEKNGLTWQVMNLQGREFMTPIDCPFKKLDSLLQTPQPEPSPSKGCISVLDFHAESTQEKEALALYADGRISVMAGTHTHVQTADERILPRGTAYITDLGMSGVLESVIGMAIPICLERNRTQIPLKMELAQGKGRIQGICVTIDRTTKKSQAIQRFSFSPVIINPL